MKNSNCKIQQQKMLKNRENHEQISINKDKEVLHEKKGLQKFKYEQLATTLQEENDCCAFTFDTSSQILFVGCEKCIKIFKFDNGKLEILDQQLVDHKDYVTCLVFMDKHNQLVSGSDDCSIIIWQQNKNNYWIPIQKLINHQNSITCLIKGLDENLMISGSIDKTIKIWKNVNNSWQCQQEITLQFEIQSLSLNPSQTKLIVCGYESPIQVMAHNNILGWIIDQTIDLYEWGNRLLFINDQQFIFQPCWKEFLEIYNYQQESKQFKLEQRLKIQNCNSCFYYYQIEYIKQKNLVLVKHGEFINIYLILENGEFLLQQSIQFGSPWLFGKLTNDGQFLITWDGDDVINNKGSFQIQVRKLEQIQ